MQLGLAAWEKGKWTLMKRKYLQILESKEKYQNSVKNLCNWQRWLCIEVPNKVLKLLASLVLVINQELPIYSGHSISPHEVGLPVVPRRRTKPNTHLGPQTNFSLFINHCVSRFYAKDMQKHSVINKSIGLCIIGSTMTLISRQNILSH